MLAAGGGPKLLLHRGDGHDAAMGILQMHPRLFRQDRSRLQQQDAGDDLQAVGDAMLHFLQQDFLLPQQLFHRALGRPLFRDVLDRQQDEAADLVLLKHGAGIEQHGAPSQPGEVAFDLVGLHHRILRQDALQQQAQLGNVPLAVRQRIDARALNVLPFELEDRVERPAGGDDLQILVENEQRLADGIDDRLGQNAAVGYSDEGFVVIDGNLHLRQARNRAIRRFGTGPQRAKIETISGCNFTDPPQSRSTCALRQAESSPNRRGILEPDRQSHRGRSFSACGSCPARLRCATPDERTA